MELRCPGCGRFMFEMKSPQLQCESLRRECSSCKKDVVFEKDEQGIVARLIERPQRGSFFPSTH